MEKCILRILRLYPSPPWPMFFTQSLLQCLEHHSPCLLNYWIHEYDLEKEQLFFKVKADYVLSLFFYRESAAATSQLSMEWDVNDSEMICDISVQIWGCLLGFTTQHSYLHKPLFTLCYLAWFSPWMWFLKMIYKYLFSIKILEKSTECDFP